MKQKAAKAINTVVILLCLSLIACTGCSSILDRLTPASVSDAGPEYAGQTPKDYYSLHEVKMMQEHIIIKHHDTQIDLKRLAEDDELAYTDALGFIQKSIAESMKVQDQIIGDDNNPLSVSGLLFLLTGGLIGRSYFRRPGDLTVDEAKAKGAAV